MNANWRKWLFGAAAVFDAVLGLVFLFFWEWPFRLFAVTPPNHAGYVQFPGLLLIIFALLFVKIARDPAGHRDLIPYGMGLKAAYSGLVFWYALTSGVPSMWIPWAWADVAFLILFAAAWASIPAVGGLHVPGPPRAVTR